MQVDISGIRASFVVLRSKHTMIPWLSFVCVFCRLRARGALEDRLEELGVDPMRTKITEEELENARARLAGQRASKVS